MLTQEEKVVHQELKHTVVVVVSFPISAPKASHVLERWNVRKTRLKRYMRQYRRAQSSPKVESFPKAQDEELAA